MIPVTIAMPCYKRGGPILEKVLASIARQKPAEILIVEDDYDGGETRRLALDFGARYIHIPRAQDWPEFQSVSKLWNICINASENEFLIMQSSDVVHESPNVIDELVKKVLGRGEVTATALVRQLAEDGSFINWYNHPTEPGRPGWVFGGAPHIFRPYQLRKMGGYEELFYGYGHEDDFFFYLLKKNGYRHEYVESAVTAHQWHERPHPENISAYANRSLIHLLVEEVEAGRRRPVANAEGLPDVAYFYTLTSLVSDGCRKEPGPAMDWARNWLERGIRDADIVLQARNELERQGLTGMVLLAEAVLADIRILQCMGAAALPGKPDGWMSHCNRSAMIHSAWRNRAAWKASELSD